MTEMVAVGRADRLRAAGGMTGWVSRHFDTLAQIKEAYERRDWIALGYESWSAYVEGELGPDKLPTSDRFRAKVLDLAKPPAARRVDQRSVYFIQAVAGGLIKIGVAGYVPGRFADIQRMCPIPLVLLATIPDAGMERETELHQRFSFARRHGEWFEPIPELLAYIEQFRHGTK